VGFELLQGALAARALSQARDATWRVLVGYKVTDEDFAALNQQARRAGDGLIVERARGDFPTLLMNCRLSISQGGYNTVMETLRAGARAVVVPYAGGIETEQTLRARLLAGRGALEVVSEQELDAVGLAAAVDRALQGPPAQARVDTGGAARTAALLTEWLA
jgi:predicted glycosyltransferase